jgi:pimeloyl-ACP methyl ester carboxylesterase
VYVLGGGEMKWIWVCAAALILLSVAVYLILDPETVDLDEAARSRIGGAYIELTQGITHYNLEGPTNGRVVVLVHGGTVPMWTWDKQVSALTGAGYRVLTYDAYGRGYSDRPNGTYDQRLYQRQLLELVDSLSLQEPFDLVGLSLGGGTAVNFTANHPQRVRKLILISPLIQNYKVVRILQVPVLGEFVARLVGIRVIVNRFRSLFENHPDAEVYTRLFVEQTTYRGFQRSMLSMLRNDAVGDYRNAYRTVGKQDREVLLIWGTGDEEITEGMVRDIRSLVPHLLFKPVQGVGHGIVFQQPEIVNKFLLNFLSMSATRI